MNGAAANGRAQRSAAATTGMTRLVREVDAPPSVLWATLLPAAGFALLTWFGTGPFAVNDIEATVAREVRGELQRKGFAWANVAVGGQEVLLSGAAPAPGAGEAALEAARAATCPTWAGPQRCAVTVLGAFDAATGPAAPAAPAMPAVPSAGASSVAASAAPTSAAAAACDAAFAALLGTAKIEFASGGTAIDARSGELLDRLAAAARGCPGQVQIEGHTDNVGDPADNQRLSTARALAVRDALVKRGMPAERLLAVGHGETQPLADNSDEAGRAANRRINFKALP